jgi:hypothetical protein
LVSGRTVDIRRVRAPRRECTLELVTDDEIVIRALMRLAGRYRATARRQTDGALRAGFERHALECSRRAIATCAQPAALPQPPTAEVRRSLQ